MKFHDLSIQEMQQKLLAGELTSVELTQQCLQRIRATDGQLNAFITICEEEALAAACTRARPDRRHRRGDAMGPWPTAPDPAGPRCAHLHR